MVRGRHRAEGNPVPEAEDAGCDKTLPRSYAMGLPRNLIRFSGRRGDWVG